MKINNGQAGTVIHNYQASGRYRFGVSTDHLLFGLGRIDTVEHHTMPLWAPPKAAIFVPSFVPHQANQALH